jgi:hypothetical protein
MEAPAAYSRPLMRHHLSPHRGGLDDNSLSDRPTRSQVVDQALNSTVIRNHKRSGHGQIFPGGPRWQTEDRSPARRRRSQEAESGQIHVVDLPLAPTPPQAHSSRLTAPARPWRLGGWRVGEEISHAAILPFRLRGSRSGSCPERVGPGRADPGTGFSGPGLSVRELPRVAPVPHASPGRPCRPLGGRGGHHGPERPTDRLVPNARTGRRRHHGSQRLATLSPERWYREPALPSFPGLHWPSSLL